MSSSKTRFNKILEILLQSAALYTVSLLGYIVLSFVHVNINKSNIQTLSRLSLYAGTVLSVTVVRSSSLYIHLASVLMARDS